MEIEMESQDVYKFTPTFGRENSKQNHFFNQSKKNKDEKKHHVIKEDEKKELFEKQ